MKEVFKTIAGFEGQYQISNLGRVKSLGNNVGRKEKFLGGSLNAGYKFISFQKNGIKLYIPLHRLVATQGLFKTESYSEEQRTREFGLQP